MLVAVRCRVHRFPVAFATSSSSMLLSSMHGSKYAEFLLTLANSCESENIECLDQQGANNLASTALSNWHKTCDSLLPALTTPMLSSFTTTKALNENPQYCSQLVTICASAATTAVQCSNSYPSNSQKQEFLSCLCKEPVISAASVCEYDGNKTCFGQPAAYSNIDIWNACPVSASDSRESSNATDL